jgi:hypothetical protein
LPQGDNAGLSEPDYLLLKSQGTSSNEHVSTLLDSRGIAYRVRDALFHMYYHSSPSLKSILPGRSSAHFILFEFWRPCVPHHAGNTRVNPIAGKTNTEISENEPRSVFKFEAAGTVVEHSTVLLREYEPV